MSYEKLNVWVNTKYDEAFEIKNCLSTERPAFLWITIVIEKAIQLSSKCFSAGSVDTIRKTNSNSKSIP